MKRRGGAMLVIKKDVKVVKMKIGEGTAEVLKSGMKRTGGGARDFAAVYVPPETNA